MIVQIQNRNASLTFFSKKERQNEKKKITKIKCGTVRREKEQLIFLKILNNLNDNLINKFKIN